MSLKNLHVEVVNMTVERATTIRVNHHFDKQRPIVKDHVNRLAVEMKLGWFLEGTPIWLCETPDGNKYLVNGQHTLEAIREAQMSVPITVITQQVRDMKAVAQAYTCFDIQRSRTWMQSAVAYGMDKEMPLLRYALGAAAIILNEFRDGRAPSETTQKSRQARLDKLREYRSALTVINGALLLGPIENRRLIFRSEVFAVAMETARYQPSSAEEFWGGMIMDDGLKANDPRKVLLRYLNNKPAHAARDDTKKAAALAWNAFFVDRPLEVLRPRQLKVFRIEGTPYGDEKRERENTRSARFINGKRGKDVTIKQAGSSL